MLVLAKTVEDSLPDPCFCGHACVRCRRQGRRGMAIVAISVALEVCALLVCLVLSLHVWWTRRASVPRQKNTTREATEEAQLATLLARSPPPAAHLDVSEVALTHLPESFVAQLTHVDTLALRLSSSSVRVERLHALSRLASLRIAGPPLALSTAQQLLTAFHSLTTLDLRECRTVVDSNNRAAGLCTAAVCFLHPSSVSRNSY